MILPTQHPASPPSKGSALVITLAIIALVTGMLLGFASLTRHETVVSNAHVNRVNAQHFAQMGVDFVIAAVKQQISNPNLVWASQPGALIVPDTNATHATNTLTTRIPLHSGYPSAEALARPSADPFAPANLNIPTLENAGHHLLTNQPTDPDVPSSPVRTLPLRWLYVREDGTLDPADEPDLTASANPVVGRLAWWADDESCKINLNTAWKRNPPAGGTGLVNPFPASHPSQVHLPSLAAYGLTEAMADQIHAYVTPPNTSDGFANYVTVKQFFNTAGELRSLGADFSAVHHANQFELTHYNHDPDTTFFNEPRIVLTTIKEKAGGRPFIDIVKKDATEIWDPIEHLDADKLADTVALLNRYLQRNDWPMAPGSSFQDKYFQGRADRITQFSLNIINYVRSRESAGHPTLHCVIPIRGEHPPGGRFILKRNTPGSHAYIGITRTPKITEMGLWVDASGNARIYVEVHLPKNFGLESFDLSKLSLWTSVNSPGVNGTPPETTITAAEIVNNSSSGAGDPILKPGGYATICRKGKLTIISPRPGTARLLCAISLPDIKRLDLAPLSHATLKLDPVGTDPLAITSIEVDDPRINSHANDWKMRDNGNSFGRANDGSCEGNPIHTLGAPSITVPEQDTDRDGNITDFSLYMPPPASAYGEAFVESVGELGFIQTGMESNAVPGIPWRTLRLQPNQQPADVVPDWAFMDIFTVPTTLPANASPRARQFFNPQGGSAGRINLNSQLQPWGDPAQTSQPIIRHLPLIALLHGVSHSTVNDPSQLNARLSFEDATNLARRLYQKTLAATGKTYGHPGIYDSPGEFIEIAGIADQGEQSESLVRALANLVSTRSAVFCVHSVGQTLKIRRQDRQLLITGECRQRTFFEIYQHPAAPGQWRLRRVLYEPLNP